MDFLGRKNLLALNTALIVPVGSVLRLLLLAASPLLAAATTLMAAGGEELAIVMVGVQSSWP